MGPLAGKRIVEIGGIGPGPFCGMLFADMGADVIVIDRKPGAGEESEPTLDPEYAIVNRGKRSIALDLKQAGAKDVVLRLLANADGLIEGFRPGVMERLGLGPDRCLAANNRLIYGRMTGWGQDGPLSHAAGHDLNYIALSGALYYGAQHVLFKQRLADVVARGRDERVGDAATDDQRVNQVRQCVEYR